MTLGALAAYLVGARVRVRVGLGLGWGWGWGEGEVEVEVEGEGEGLRLPSSENFLAISSLTAALPCEKQAS